MPLTLLNKEDEAKETERLRVGAEDIADLSSNGEYYLTLVACRY